MYVPTTATRKLLSLRKRLRGVSGGTSAGKTISIEQILIDAAQSDTVPTLTSIVSESFPHLKRGALRDFLDIMRTQGYFDDARWNKTDYTYMFETGSRIEFFSVDQPGKVHGPRRDRLFINEANNISYETFDQLTVRTRDVIWLDWNPTSEFWWYTDVLLARDVDFVKLNYRDNEALAPAIIQDIESHQQNKLWWSVYGLGELGEAEGRIYTGWQIIDDIPFEARLERRGLDFGYTNDPSALLDVYSYNGGFMLDEQLYQKGMSNKAIADFINNLADPRTLVIADSAEPKSIEELKLYGINVLPAQKGPGSVNQGIQYVQAQKISITKRSINLIREYRNHLWQTDRDGRIINVPEPGNDHLLDGGRYALESFQSRNRALPAAHDPFYARRK